MKHRHVAKFLLVSASFLALEMSVARADEMVRNKIASNVTSAQRVANGRQAGGNGNTLRRLPN